MYSKFEISLNELYAIRVFAGERAGGNHRLAHLKDKEIRICHNADYLFNAGFNWKKTDIYYKVSDGRLSANSHRILILLLDSHIVSEELHRINVNHNQKYEIYLSNVVEHYQKYWLQNKTTLPLSYYLSTLYKEMKEDTTIGSLHIYPQLAQDCLMMGLIDICAVWNTVNQYSPQFRDMFTLCIVEDGHTHEYRTDSGALHEVIYRPIHPTYAPFVIDSD